MATDEHKDSVSMVEVLEEEQKLEDDATAVLGGSDAVHCTYPKGYLQRQALYSCATCTGSEGQVAGICLACSLDCHEGHDLYELYTKRNFACDCGNSKFADRKCKLFPEKSAVNEKNSYNQNFRGLYCTCHRPYPDPEDEIEDAMIQCVICEDWYHGRHLKADIPEDSSYDEMICYQCMKEHPFFWQYRHLQVTDEIVDCVKVTEEVKGEHISDYVGQSGLNGTAASEQTGDSCVHDNGSSVNVISETEMTKEQMKVGEKMTVGISKRDEMLRPETDKKQEKSQKEQGHLLSAESSDTCLLSRLQFSECCMPDSERSTFWKHGWRASLCQCTKCKQMYEDEGISFITSLSDTITVYEASGRLAQDSSATQYERGMAALSQMNRIQQVEVLHGFNDLKTQLKDYLKKFAENGKVVKEEDIKEFFTELTSRKKQKVNIPFYCK